MRACPFAQPQTVSFNFISRSQFGRCLGACVCVQNVGFMFLVIIQIWDLWLHLICVRANVFAVCAVFNANFPFCLAHPILIYIPKAVNHICVEIHTAAFALSLFRSLSIRQKLYSYSHRFIISSVPKRTNESRYMRITSTRNIEHSIQSMANFSQSKRNLWNPAGHTSSPHNHNRMHTTSRL